jgi:hypothetical protein
MKNNVILTENILYLLIDRMIQVDSAIPLEDAQTNDLDNDEEGIIISLFTVPISHSFPSMFY